MSFLFDSQLVKRQALACRVFDQAVARRRLSHAYLFTGRAANDKLLLAKYLAGYLNCEREDKSTHGSCLVHAHQNANLLESNIDLQPNPSKHADLCRNCRWIWNQTHPQAWLTLGGEENKSGRIAVERARVLALELSKVSQYTRVVIIPDATRDCFAAPAANALLKTIEEPGDNSMFLLFAPDAASVLPTIVSRCQIVPVVQSLTSLFHFPSEDKQEQEELAAEYEVDSFPGSVSQAMYWASQLEQAAGEELDSHFLIDWIIFKKFEQLKSQAAVNPEISAHLDHVFTLAQTAKDQLDSYVQPRAAFESFALSSINS